MRRSPSLTVHLWRLGNGVGNEVRIGQRSLCGEGERVARGVARLLVMVPGYANLDTRMDMFMGWLGRAYTLYPYTIHVRYV